MSPIEMHDCPRCGRPVAVELPEVGEVTGGTIGAGAQALVRKMARLRKCTRCEDAELREEREQRRKQAEANFRRRLAVSQLPKKYHELSWEDMRREWGRAEVIDAVRAWCREGGSLFLYSRPGPGKTRLAGVACWQLLKDGRQPRFVQASVLLTKANASYGSEWRDQAEEILLTGGPLILDDLGKEKPTPLARQLLQSAIDDRIDNNVPLLITSNEDPAMLGAIYGDWLASRVGAMVQWVMPGPDLRLEV